MKIFAEPKTLKKCLENICEGDTLFLRNGVYEEKLEILVDNINIIGESKDGVIIENKDFYHKIMPDYNECNTFRTYTVLIGGNNTTVENLTIKNLSTPSSKYGQAVALSVLGDNVVVKNVSLISAQDTLFTGPLPINLCERYKNFLPEYYLDNKPRHQVFYNCDIEGDVDFIFGGAQAYFYKCNIKSIKRTNNSNEVNGYISAPSHKKSDRYGYLFYKCNLISDAKNIYLSRPWRDYGTVAFIDNEYNLDINPEGFNKWDGTERDKTARFYESKSKYTDKRLPWVKILDEKEKEEYVKSFLKEFDPIILNNID